MRAKITLGVEAPAAAREIRALHANLVSIAGALITRQDAEIQLLARILEVLEGAEEPREDDADANDLMGDALARVQGPGLPRLGTPPKEEEETYRWIV